MKKIIYYLAAALIVAGSGFTAHAEETNTNLKMEGRLQPSREAMEQKREEIKEKAEEARQTMRAEFEKKKMDFRQEMETKRMEFQKQLETRKAEFEKEIEKHKSELKERLKNIKDTVKKDIVERVDARLIELNKNRVEFFTKAVDQIEKVLAGLIERTDKAAAAGTDVTTVRAAITKAQAAIAAARTAIVAQSGKTYKITVSTDGKLRTDVKVVRDMVEKDLLAVREKVRSAREAVRDAVKALAAVRPTTSNGTNASGTASTTNP